MDLALEKLISMALETQKAKIRGLDSSLQFEHLIIKLVQELFQDTATPLLIVIDALDECDQYQKILPSLKSWSWLLSFPLILRKALMPLTPCTSILFLLRFRD